MQCNLCGFGKSLSEEEFSKQHGEGICCDKCQYCREGVMHAPGVCANIVKGRGDRLPQAVREFLDYHDAWLTERAFYDPQTS